MYSSRKKEMTAYHELSETLLLLLKLLYVIIVDVVTGFFCDNPLLLCTFNLIYVVASRKHL